MAIKASLDSHHVGFRLLISQAPSHLFLNMAFSFVTSGVKLDGQGNAILTDSPTPSGSATLTDRQAYGQRRCACCSLPGCNLWCSGCDIQDVGKIRTFYCSRECQVKHRPDHKANCTARLHLARAASICFELFVAFEKATHIKTTEKVAEKNGVVTIGREDGDMRPWSGGSLFLQYPEEVLPSGTPAELMASILLDQTCGEVFTTARPLLSRFIQHKSPPAPLSS